MQHTYIHTVNCLSNGLSVDIGDESFFFPLSSTYLKKKNHLRTLDHQWLHSSFIFEQNIQKNIRDMNY